MPLILNIETSTTVCSVALADSGKVMAYREINAGYTHAENLHVFIEEALEAAGVKPRDLEAIAVGRGPGSYTGLRIGVSAAKGLAYALSIPLISVSTLLQMTLAASQQKGDCYYCPMLDARRMEVYLEVFDQDLRSIRPVSALVISEDSVKQLQFDKPLCFFGDGMPKVRHLLENLPGSGFLEDVHPSALHMAGLSHQAYLAQAFEDVAYFEPFYLKEFVSGGHAS